jgi:hypothetical protein
MVDHEETDDVLTTIIITYCGQRVAMRFGDGMEHLDGKGPKCPTCWPPGGMGPGHLAHRAASGRN